jgi:hypothetical protein
MELDHRRFLVADKTTIKVYGYTHDMEVDPETQENAESKPVLIMNYDINRKEALPQSPDDSMI